MIVVMGATEGMLVLKMTSSPPRLQMSFECCILGVKSLMVHTFLCFNFLQVNQPSYLG